MAAVRVDNWLYVGGLSSLDALPELASHAIVLGFPPAPAALPSDCVLAVELADEDDADLLAVLPGCLAFASAPSVSTLLVACHAGVSRSAAVATALLMHRHSLSFSDAFARLRAAHPAASPNDGFVQQLKVFGASGTDSNHAAARRHRVGLLAAAHACGTAQAGDAAGVLGAEASSAGAGCVRCRSCRRLLASAEQRLPHERGAGSTAFDIRKRQKAGSRPAATEQACSSVFVDPLAWMGPELAAGLPEGKLHCPKCAARLGCYAWAGAQCSCGAWVTPAFQLHVARCDVEPGN